MKILHIITGLNNGGAEAVLYRLICAGQKSGDQNYVISLMDRGIYADRLEQTGCVVDCLNMPRGRITFRGLIKLYRRIKIINPEVVQTWMYHADLIGGIAARLAGVRPIVWGIRHSNFDPGKNRKLTLLIIRLCALLSSCIPTKIACCSVKAAPLHQNIGYRADKIIVIPNGYALDRVKPCIDFRDDIRKELRLDNHALVIGMVARFDPQKDHQNLVNALMLLTQQRCPYMCLLVGDGMTEDNIKMTGLIRDAGIEKNILLLGPRGDVPAIMNALDLHVLSSLGEAFPNVLAEAMACGTPCVTTDVGDAALIVGDTGWVIPPHDPASLASAITTALAEKTEKPEAWQHRQKACRQHIIDNFSLAKMHDSYQQLWLKAVAAEAIHLGAGG